MVLGRRPVIGFLTHNLIGDYLTTQWLALRDHAARLDVDLQIHTPFIFYSQKVNRDGFFRTFDLAAAENIDGLIISGSSLNVFFPPSLMDGLYRRLAALPIVTLASEHPGVPSVSIDNHRGFYDLTRHLVVDHGYRDFAFLAGTEGNVDAQVRFEAFCRCLDDHGISLDPAQVFPGDFGNLSGRAAVEEMVDRRGRRPRALVCANDDMALGAMEELRRRGLRIPEDMAVVGFDDIGESSHPGASLTTVSQGIAEQAERALDLVVDRIRGREIPQATRISPTLVVRRSCGCPAPGAETGTEGTRRRPVDPPSEKGYNIGQLTTFTRNIMEALTLEGFTQELQSLCLQLKIPTVFLAVYNHGAPQEEGWDHPPPRSTALFSLVDGKVLPPGQEFDTASLVPDREFHQARRRTTLVSEVTFQNDHYGYFVLEMFQSDPVLFHLVNLEVSNGFRHIWVKKKMDEAYHKLEALDTMKNQFIANVTHDFRSPLTVTLGMAELGMQEFPPGSEDHGRYRTVFEASLKLKATVDRFLDLSRMDNFGLSIRAARLKLSPFLAELTGFYRSSLVNSTIQISYLPPDVEPDDFFTDQDKLEEILSNLISNALKFVDPTRGEIRLRAETGEDEVRIHVADNGVGIAPDQQDAIFQRFTQLAPGRNQRFRGTGIGLAFSRQLAGFLKGTLEVRSEGPGLGSDFILTLPRGRGRFTNEELLAAPAWSDDHHHRVEARHLFQIQVQDLEQDETVVELAAVNPENEFDPTKAVILIIEDSRPIRAMQRECLARRGYANFVLASDGARGLEAAYRYRPDLILCDLNLPGLRGDEVYDQLTRNHDFKKTPFIFVSAVSDRDFVLNLRQRGVEVFLTKPVETTDLVMAVDQQVKNAMERKKLQRDSQFDELTGLLNRRHLMFQVQRQFAHRSYVDNAFVFLDIDRFKGINDTYGHPVGDRVLAAVGACLKENLRPQDLCGRYGGEEFLILLPHTPLAPALVVAEKLRALIEALPIPFEGGTLGVTASFGVASLKDHEALLTASGEVPPLETLFAPRPGSAIDWDQRDAVVAQVQQALVSLADQALYQAKRAGRNLVKAPPQGQPTEA